MSYDGADEDEVIFIPLKTGMRRLFNVNYIKNIYVQIDKKENMKIAENEIIDILRESHKLNARNKKNDFTLQNVYTTLKAQNETNDAFTLLISGVAGLALLVGGIGISAIMILSIKERNFEIGLRVAVGAKPKDLFIQFLAEAIFLSFIGGLIGVISGVILSIAASYYTNWVPAISIDVILVSVVFSFFLGIVFGVYPAVKASKLDPIIALNA